VLAAPFAPVERRAEDVELHRERGRRAMLNTLSHEQAAVASARARLTALGPAATMSRGYTVVQYPDEAGNLQVLRSISEVAEGTTLRVRVVDGAVHATVVSTEPGE
jgi:exodeoxyribonuclease VII large subunit